MSLQRNTVFHWAKAWNQPCILYFPWITASWTSCWRGSHSWLKRQDLWHCTSSIGTMKSWKSYTELIIGWWNNIVITVIYLCDIWQASLQQCCRDACQISHWYHLCIHRHWCWDLLHKLLFPWVCRPTGSSLQVLHHCEGFPHQRAAEWTLQTSAQGKITRWPQGIGQSFTHWHRDGKTKIFSDAFSLNFSCTHFGVCFLNFETGQIYDEWNGNTFCITGLQLSNGYQWIPLIKCQ